ncbi:hypothetical protein K2X33_14740 [bacterium]|nr:hypothetical protein [bacterium]
MYLRLLNVGLFILALVPTWSSAESHGGSVQSVSSSATSRSSAPTDKPNLEAEDRKKLLNETADSDLSQSEGREKLQKVTDDIWRSLSETQKKDLDSEIQAGGTGKLDELLKQNGLVLSSPDKRAEFVKAFQAQMKANAKRGSAAGLEELITTASQDAKGDPAKRQDQLAAKAALQAEIKKNQSAVDYLTKHLKWSQEDAVRTVRHVEEQFKTLTNGSSSAEQKSSAETYLKSVFGQLKQAKSESDVTAASIVSDFYTNKNLRESEFGKVADLFITAAKGYNTATPQNPLGNCAGLLCIRGMTKEALEKNGAFKGEAKDIYEALNKYSQTGTFPASVNGKPTLSDGVLNEASDVLNRYENEGYSRMNNELMTKLGIKDPFKFDERLSNVPVDKMFEMKGATGNSLSINLKPNKSDLSSHAVDVKLLGGGNSQPAVVGGIDPNSPEPFFDLQQTGDGTVSYTINGKKKTYPQAKYPVYLDPEYQRGE